MFVRSALCLLVVLICYREISAQGGIGSSCVNNEGCRGGNTSVCLDQVCVCISNHVPDSTNGTCIPRVGYGETCTEDIQCELLGEAQCFPSSCICRQNFNFNGQRCTGNLGLGTQCQRDAECSVPNDPRQLTVWCSGNQCACRPGYRRDGDRCFIGGDCTSDDGCIGLANSVCNQVMRDRPRCSCAPGFIAVGNNTFCNPIATSPGGGCEFHEQCTERLVRAECVNSQCRCVERTTLQADGTCGAAVRILLSLSCFVLALMAKLL